MLQCNAKIIVKGSELVRENNTHTHAPDQANIAALLALQKMKSRARESLETPQQIISKEFECSDQGVASNLPTIRHLKSNLRCQRQRSQMSIPLTLSTQDLNIPDEFKVTKKN